jgi:amino acid transporter
MAAAAAAPGPRSTRRTLGAVRLGILAFFVVCGGPFGIEQAVAAAGVFPTLVGCGVLAVAWALPQALVTAEMACLYRNSGGYISWVSGALGRYWGAVNGAANIVTVLIDIAVYVRLFGHYLRQYTALSLGAEVAAQVALVAFVVALNVRGVEALAWVSGALTAVILAPFFFAEPVLVAPTGPALDGLAHPIHWVSFVGVLLWCWQGWDDMGPLAGEVRDPGRSYPRGAALAVALIVANYLLPVAVGANVNAHAADWSTCDLVCIAQHVRPWLGWWVLIGALVSSVGQYASNMASYARALARTAAYGLLPRVFARNATRWRTPVAALLLLAASTLALMRIPFDVLVVIDTSLNNVTLAFETWAFLHLKFAHPSLPRPFAVPGGVAGALAVCSLKIGVLVFYFVTLGSSWQQFLWMVIVAGLLALSALWVAWRAQLELGGAATTERRAPLLGDKDELPLPPGWPWTDRAAAAGACCVCRRFHATLGPRGAWLRRTTLLVPVADLDDDEDDGASGGGEASEVAGAE